MSRNQTEVGKAQEYWNVSGTRILKYTIEMYHRGLNEHKLISAPEVDMLDNKVNLQTQKWTEKWEIIELKRKIAKEKEANLDEANSRTEEAVEALKKIDDLLIYTLSIDDTVDWENLKKKEKYPEKVPSKPIPKIKKEYPSKPEKEFPVFTFFEKLIKSKKERKIQDCENRYSAEISNWEKQKTIVDKLNNQLDKDFEKELKEWEHEVPEWEKRKNNFL